MKFIIAIVPALLLNFVTLVSSGEDDYDPCKAGSLLVNFFFCFEFLSSPIRITARYIYKLLTTFNSNVSAAFVNGDIAISQSELVRLRRTRRAATALRNRRWKHGTIPYEIDDVFTGMATLQRLFTLRVECSNPNTI